jgi:hypothetical protein
MVPTLAVINASTVVLDHEVALFAAALQVQISRDFAPAWGFDAKVVQVKRGQKPLLGSWWLPLLDDAPSAGYLGYHDLTDEGLPIGKVFVKTTMSSGGIWTVTGSHEALEMGGDPDIDRATVVIPRSGLPYAVAYEACDACEGDQFSYKVNGVPLSDFVHPAWFSNTSHPAGTKFDHGGHINRPLELLADGYIGEFHWGVGWTQRTADSPRSCQRSRGHLGSRRERRKVPHAERVCSSVKFEPSFGDTEAPTEAPTENS